MTNERRYEDERCLPESHASVRGRHVAIEVLCAQNGVRARVLSRGVDIRVLT